MAPKILAVIESVRTGAATAAAVIEIDEVVPIIINGAVLYAREIRV